jgi:hypothetical protein
MLWGQVDVIVKQIIQNFMQTIIDVPNFFMPLTTTATALSDIDVEPCPPLLPSAI